MTGGFSGEGLRTVLPWAWFVMSLVWAIVIVVTDQLAWPLALWIATTVGPLTYLKTNSQTSARDDRSRKDGE